MTSVIKLRKEDFGDQEDEGGKRRDENRGIYSKCKTLLRII